MSDDFAEGLAKTIIEQRNRIEALEAALSTAQQVIYDLTEGITGTTQRDRIEALEKALREILDWDELPLRIQWIARAALAPESEK